LTICEELQLNKTAKRTLKKTQHVNTSKKLKR